jgi:carbon storage regulator CsrA
LLTHNAKRRVNTMLCLTVKEGDFVKIGDAKVFVLEIDRGKIRLGVEAPKEVLVLRQKNTRSIIRRPVK